MPARMRMQTKITRSAIETSPPVAAARGEARAGGVAMQRALRAWCPRYFRSAIILPNNDSRVLEGPQHHANRARSLLHLMPVLRRVDARLDQGEARARERLFPRGA